jgi:hypothetical protein
MSIFPTRNWQAELREREAQDARMREILRRVEAQKQAIREYEAEIHGSDVAKEASEGVVIEGTAVRKPQPHLT